MNPEQLLGRSIHDIDWAEQATDVPPVVEEIDGVLYVDLPRLGLSVVADASSVINAVQMHAEGHNGCAQYEGQLPANVSFSMGRSVLRRRLGPPEDSGEPTVIVGLGRMNAWDRWRLDDGTWLHGQYSDDEERTELFTLMSEPPPPVGALYELPAEPLDP